MRMSLFPSDDELEIIKIRHKIQLGISTKEHYLTFMVIPCHLILFVNCQFVFWC